MVKKKKGKKPSSVHIFIQLKELNFFFLMCNLSDYLFDQNMEESTGKEHLKKLHVPCQIHVSAIRFTGNSVAINFCARRS